MDVELKKSQLFLRKIKSSSVIYCVEIGEIAHGSKPSSFLAALFAYFMEDATVPKYQCPQNFHHLEIFLGLMLAAISQHLIDCISGRASFMMKPRPAVPSAGSTVGNVRS